MKIKTVTPGDYDNYVKVLKGKLAGKVGFYDDDDLAEEGYQILDQAEATGLNDEEADRLLDPYMRAVVYFGTPLLSDYKLIRYQNLAYATEEEIAAFQAEHETEEAAERAKHRMRAKIAAPREGDTIYFVRTEEGGPIKIGFTTDLWARIQGLQTSCHKQVLLEAAMPGSRWEEGRLHDWFRPARIRGEWFYPVPELLDYIKQVVEVGLRR